MNYFIQRGDQQYGPYTLAELQQYLAAGNIVPSDLARSEGMEQWLPVWQVAGTVAVPVTASGAAVAPALGEPGTAEFEAARLIAESRHRFLAFGGFWIRWVAALLDWILTSVAGFVVGAFLGLTLGRPGTALAQLFGIVIAWLYEALLTSSSRQATLGKTAMGLRVVDEQGRRISFARATGRHFAKILSAITLFIGYIMAGMTARKQALHDLVAGTFVIRS
jgi:uncharacterized RDD family membrane protein YckC